jgi:hypothetical protein
VPLNPEALAPLASHVGSVCGEESLGLDLNSLREKLPSASSKDICQWIIDLAGLAKWNNVANLFHGVSLSLRGSGRLDTRLDRRLSHSVITQFPA